MPVHDDLGTRMKTYYEQIPKMKLMRRCPAMIRIDGKAFHTFTKGFERPFDEVLMKSMQETTQYLCQNIQGCVLGYTQSDEISLVLIDYQRLETAAWFDYEIQKMVSVAASMATMAFQKFFSENVKSFEESNGSKELLLNAYKRALKQGAMFDARVFNIPKEEVTNCIYWRQLDAARNSVQMAGQAHFSQSQLHGKSCSMIQDMLMLQKGINWNDYPAYQKRGTCVVKEVSENKQEEKIKTSNWKIDKEIPLFKGEGREYIEKLILPDSDY